MPSTIDQHFVQAYKGNLRMLASQKGSKLQKHVEVEPNAVGKRLSEDFIGPATGQKITTRHGDTPLNEMDHSRRWVTMSDWNTAALLDKLDKPKMLADPTNKYVLRQAGFFGRCKDWTLIDAMLGSAEYGVEGGFNQALPAGQKIAHDSTGLTIAKLIEIREKFGLGELEDEEIYPVMAITQYQVSQLLKQTEVQSHDFNTLKPLVEGRVVRFMGLDFVVINGKREDLTSPIIPLDGSGHRTCVAWIPDRVKLWVGEDVTVDIGPRRDKNMATQVYSEMSIGAVRLEDIGVVQVDCDDSWAPST